MKDFLGSTMAIVFVAGYTLGPIFGLYAAVSNGSFGNAVASVVLPWYGIIYWLFS